MPQVQPPPISVWSLFDPIADKKAGVPVQGNVPAFLAPNVDPSTEVIPPSSPTTSLAGPRIKFDQSQMVRAKSPTLSQMPDPSSSPPDQEAPDYEQQYQKQFAQGMADQQAQYQKQKADLDKLGDRPTGLDTLDLSGLMALSDHINGSHNAQSYRPPQEQEKYDARKQALTAALEKTGQGMSKDQLEFLKQKVDEKKNEDAGRLREMMLGQRGSAADWREDGLANRVGNAVTNDKLLTGNLQRRQQIEMDMHTIDTAQKLSPQILAEIQNGIAQALAGGSASVHDKDRQEVVNLDTRLASIKQQVGDGLVDISSPNLKADIKDILNRLHQAYDRNIEIRKQTLKSGLSNLHSQRARQFANDRLDSLGGEGSSAGPQVGDVEDGHTFIGGDPQDPASWSK